MQCNGALTSDVIEAIQQGALIGCLPDQFNRNVLSFDRNQGTGSFQHNAALRQKVFFYTLHTITESDLAVVNGFVGLI